jgi:hypothetical protein
MSNIVKRRGRPKGTIAGKRTTEQWQPKKWKPLYDAIISLAVSGLKNVQIAQELKIDKITVGLIINSTEGQAKLMHLRVMQSQAVAKTLKDRLEKIQDKALSRVESVLNSDELAEAAPLKIFDRALRTLGSLGTVKHPEEGGPKVVNNSQTNVLVADQALMEQINVGVSKALEASALHATAFKDLAARRSLKAAN